MFNIVINKYSIFVTKTCPQHKTCVYYFQRSTRKPKITLTCLIMGDQKFDHPHPQGLSFCQ